MWLYLYVCMSLKEICSVCHSSSPRWALSPLFCPGFIGGLLPWGWSAFHFYSKHCGHYPFYIRLCSLDSFRSRVFWSAWLLCFGVAASVQVYLVLEKAGSKGTLKWKGLGFMVRSQFLGESIPQISWWEMPSPALAGKRVLHFQAYE